MNIRLYQPSDLESLMKVYMLAKQDELAGEPPHIKITPFTENSAALKLFEESDMYVYLDDQGEVIGFTGHQVNHIIWCYVHPEHRGKQIAYQLIQHIEQQLHGEVYLTLLKSNSVARRFYERMGYKTQAEFKGVHQGVTMYALKMTKQLPATN